MGVVAFAYLFARLLGSGDAPSLLANRQEKVVTGSCVIEQDTPQAVVLATLAALNRVLGGLRVKEPTEYVLRPTTN